MPTDFEVIIAGAGPAGVSTAVALVRRVPSLAGRVLILDRARFPRGKPCGGGLTGHVEEAMRELGLALNVESFPSPSAVVRFGSFRREVPLGRPVRVIRREEFDASLVEQARGLGITIEESCGITGYAVDANGVDVKTPRGERRARVLVGADGAGSLVRKQLVGNRHRRGARDTPIRLFRAELPASARVIAGAGSDENSAAMIYDFTPMRDGLRGYLWVFPVPGGRLNVGLMHTLTVERSGAELVEMLRVGLRAHGVELGDVSPRGWPVWGYDGRRTVAGSRVLTVGDAAGVDALTGEGIAVGMEHGLVAGASIARALSTGDFRFASYARELRRASVGRELVLDGRLARLLYAEQGWRRWLSLVLHDGRMLEMYAARVSGTLVLARQPVALVMALVRDLLDGKRRRAALSALERGE